MLSIFSCGFWPSVCTLWRSVYLALLPIFIGFLLILSCMSYIYILEIKPLLVTLFANILSHSLGCPLGFCMVSFAVQKLLSSIGSHLFIFYFYYSMGWIQKDIVAISVRVLCLFFLLRVL